jgi:hypothetical protein
MFPMQFSVSPGRVLDARQLSAVLESVAAHRSLAPDIIRLAKHAGRTGEPILRPLAFHYPGCEDVTGQLLLGADILAAPVLERGATSRTVRLPPLELGRRRRCAARRRPLRRTAGHSDVDPWFRRMR